MNNTGLYNLNPDLTKIKNIDNSHLLLKLPKRYIYKHKNCIINTDIVSSSLDYSYKVNRSNVLEVEDLWDSPRITPNFGGEDGKFSGSITNTIPKTIIPDIYINLINNHDQIYETFNEVDETKIVNTPNSKLSRVNSEGSRYGLNTNDCSKDINLSPLLYSTPTYRLYDLKKIRSRNQLTAINNSPNIWISDSNTDHASSFLPLQKKSISLLDTRGILGPQTFLTSSGSIHISKSGDFSFEYSSGKKNFIITGGGCFIIIKDKHSGESDIIFHVSQLTKYHIQRYIYATELCNTLKSHVPRVKLITKEGIFELMSNDTPVSDFHCMFNQKYNSKFQKVVIVSRTQEVTFFIEQEELPLTVKTSLLELVLYSDRFDKCTNKYYEEQLLEVIKQLEHLKTEWTQLLTIWRLTVTKLEYCRRLEAKGFQEYHNLTKSLIKKRQLYLNESDYRLSNINTDKEEFQQTLWTIQKEAMEATFPIVVYWTDCE
ncbi:uncharacterized protein CMU_036120 [Cryptosporidium muris RN66]|uniref:Uncharacterized protein n=1 Tax=Cryptosporidium muris (strain RN66) TaxID=441375 RepID=B6AGU8_CRYMR|nr:uncharacterized protein CMU_036120 [Cryptosporidium muris RN66]EEA07439.1 hypothetical protein, conserved [Cryptosporidium muris RN66]|eukprot:XP_002141788.1 hypothetical protein [Cryptosporidium muris RN66]